MDVVQKKSFAKATGYILNALFRSQKKHQRTANCRNRFSVALLFEITASIVALRAQVNALVTSPCRKKYITQHD